NCNTIESLADFCQCSPTCIVKNVLYLATFDNGKQVLTLVSIRGDQVINDVKLTNEITKLAGHYQASTLVNLTVPEETTLSKLTTQPLPLGYIGPDLDEGLLTKNDDLIPHFLRLVDNTAADLQFFITGANQTNFHVCGVTWQRDLPLPKHRVDIRSAQVGDRAVHDPSQTLQTARGIEVGHIFQLGTKYSRAMGATFTNEQGEEQPLVMGCYGIGVSRLAQAAVEQNHDKDGIIWPTAIAPYEVVIVVPNVGDKTQVTVAEQLYTDLQAAGIDVLLDDRNERAGVKFKDSELIGIPYRLVAGKSLKDGQVEVVKRFPKAVTQLAIADVVLTVSQWIQQDKQH
ncbi:MAG: Prolyl-tRNA synthetase, bacterial type, partial [Cyanobacteriota bacterium]